MPSRRAIAETAATLIKVPILERSSKLDIADIREIRLDTEKLGTAIVLQGRHMPKNIGNTTIDTFAGNSQDGCRQAVLHCVFIQRSDPLVRTVI